MSRINSLSDADVALLREMAAEYKHRRGNPTQRPTQQHVPPQAPEVYIAKTPASGIPGVTDWVGTSSSSSYLAAGSANCNVYQAVLHGSFRRLIPVTGLTRLVHSLSSDPVPGNIYVLIERDKFGIWWVSSTPSPIEPGPDTPIDTGGTTGTSDDVLTGTGTGPIFGCDFTADELESIAGPGLGVDFTGDCPRLEVHTTPPSCIPIVVYDVDLRCETMTGTGTSQQGSLNLYRREVSINVQGGCLTKTVGDWVFIRAVACCDPECEQEASQERFWWCINDGTTGTGGDPGGSVDTGCCEVPISTSVSFTVSGCVNGTVTLIYVGLLGGSHVWEGTGNVDCFNGLTATLSIESGCSVTITWGGPLQPANCTVSGVIVSCNPLLITADPVSGNCLDTDCPSCTAGSQTVTITD